MRETQIKKAFSDLRIQEHNLPEYSNPHEFAKHFKICSILKENEVFYSASTEEKKISCAGVGSRNK